MTELKRLVRHSQELWNSPLVPSHLSRHNRKAWVRSVLRLGDKWVFAKLVDAQPEQPPPSLLDKWLLAKRVERLQ